MGYLFSNKFSRRRLGEIQRPTSNIYRPMGSQTSTKKKRNAQPGPRNDSYMIRRKHRAYLKAKKRTSKQPDWTGYKNLGNTVRDLHRYDLDTITSNLHTNPIPFWNWIKKNKKGISCIPDLFYQGQSLSKVVDNANTFNHYFISVFAKENMNSLRNITLPSKHPTSITLRRRKSMQHFAE